MWNNADVADRFRWVACQLDALRKCAKLSELKSTLSSLPKTLDGTYERILLNIDELWQDDVRKVLQWLCFSRRSLTLDEIADALAVTFVDGAKFDPDERYPDPRDILSRCSSLVSLTVNREGEVLRLAHFSVKEYLVSQRIQSSKASMYAIAESDATDFIAQSCLAYLLQFKTVDCPNYSQIKKYSLAEYASEFWWQHMKDLEDTLSNDLQALTMQLFEMPETRRVSCTCTTCASEVANTHIYDGV